MGLGCNSAGQKWLVGYWFFGYWVGRVTLFYQASGRLVIFNFFPCSFGQLLIVQCSYPKICLGGWVTHIFRYFCMYYFLGLSKALIYSLINTRFRSLVNFSPAGSGEICPTHLYQTTYRPEGRSGQMFLGWPYIGTVCLVSGNEWWSKRSVHEFVKGQANQSSWWT